MIDFCEIIGEHSGRNMLELVWKTIEMYGLQEKVLHNTSDTVQRLIELVQVEAFVADNASNNDTLLEGLEEKFHAIGINWDSVERRL